MITSLLNALFGCSHKRTTFPITPSRRSSLSDSARRGTYVACLDCGKEFDYNWKEMRVTDTIPAPAAAASLSIVNH
jgi:phage terminase large subunit GpA-like protein